MSKNIFLKGERIYLRPFDLEDAVFLAQSLNDREVTKHLSNYYPTTKEIQIEWIKKIDYRKEIELAIITNEDDRIVGGIGLCSIDHRNRTAKLGFFLSRENWGNNFMQEAILLVAEYAFNTLNLRKICSGYISSNDRSKNLHSDTGFKIEGKRELQYYIDGKYEDYVLVALFSEDFKERR